MNIPPEVSIFPLVSCVNSLLSYQLQQSRDNGVKVEVKVTHTPERKLV